MTLWDNGRWNTFVVCIDSFYIPINIDKKKLMLSLVMARGGPNGISIMKFIMCNQLKKSEFDIGHEAKRCECGIVIK